MPVHTFVGHDKGVRQVSWAPFQHRNQGCVFASSADDCRVFIWDTSLIGSPQTAVDRDSGPPELLFVHGGHTEIVEDFNWHPSEPWLMTSIANDNVLQVWEMFEGLRLEEPADSSDAAMQAFTELMQPKDGNASAPLDLEALLTSALTVKHPLTDAAEECLSVPSMDFAAQFVGSYGAALHTKLSGMQNVLEKATAAAKTVLVDVESSDSNTDEADAVAHSSSRARSKAVRASIVLTEAARNRHNRPPSSNGAAANPAPPFDFYSLPEVLRKQLLHLKRVEGVRLSSHRGAPPGKMRSDVDAAVAALLAHVPEPMDHAEDEKEPDIPAAASLAQLNPSKSSIVATVNVVKPLTRVKRRDDTESSSASSSDADSDDDEPLLLQAPAAASGMKRVANGPPSQGTPSKRPRAPAPATPPKVSSVQNTSLPAFLDVSPLRAGVELRRLLSPPAARVVPTRYTFWKLEGYEGMRVLLRAKKPSELIGLRNERNADKQKQARARKTQQIVSAIRRDVADRIAAGTISEDEGEDDASALGQEIPLPLDDPVGAHAVASGSSASGAAVSASPLPVVKVESALAAASPMQIDVDIQKHSPKSRWRKAK
jgi:hypothetical protein